MRQRGNCGIGPFAIVIGVIIILAVVLPSRFWWILAAMCLICWGIHLCRCSR